MGQGAEAFADAVEDALACLFVEVEPQRQYAVLAGSETRLEIDEAAGRFTFSTPVEGAHDGLPADDLLDLLTFNFPNDLTRGSFLIAGAGAGHLVLTEVHSLPGLDPDEAVRAVLDQIVAALELGTRIAQRRTRRLTHEGDVHAS